MRLILFAVLIASVATGALAAAKPAPPAGPYLYTAERNRQMEVVVDVNAEKAADGTAGSPIFILYAAPLNGHDIYAEYFTFECSAGMARLDKEIGVSKYVEPLDLKDAAAQPYRVPPGSMMDKVMGVACRGRKAIPAAWTPLRLNLRQISKAYYQGYLGQQY